MRYIIVEHGENYTIFDSELNQIHRFGSEIIVGSFEEMTELSKSLNDFTAFCLDDTNTK